MTKASDLADDLIGTARTVVVEEELDTQAEVEEFDALAFVCDGCGWWCSTDELNNLTAENLCDDCHVEEDEE